MPFLKTLGAVLFINILVLLVLSVHSKLVVCSYIMFFRLRVLILVDSHNASQLVGLLVDVVPAATSGNSLHHCLLKHYILLRKNEELYQKQEKKTPSKP